MSIAQLTSQYLGDERHSGQGSLGALLENVTILLRDSMTCGGHMQTIWKKNWQLPNPWALGDKSEDSKKVFVWSKMFSNFYNNSGMNCWWYSIAHLFATPWSAAHQAPLSSTISWSFLKFMSIELVMLSNTSHTLLPPLLLPSIFPSIRVFSNESAVHIRWPKYWSFSISPSNEYSGLISFTRLISLQSKGFSRVFSSTTVWKHQFFDTQPS